MTSQQTTNMNKNSIGESQNSNEKLSWTIVVFILIIVLVGVIWFISNDDNQQTDKNDVTTIEKIVSDSSEQLNSTSIERDEDKLSGISINQKQDNPNIQEQVSVLTNEDEQILEALIEEPVSHLPALNESDDLVESKLPELTLKKHLLKLFITEDIIRRFVVFTDNFTRGSVAYEHSLFIPPKVSFSANESVNKQNNEVTLQWDKRSSERFNLYADLLRSLNTDELVAFYAEIKPLINEAYAEIGYTNDFTETLQLAITQILNAKIPNGSYELSRTSVMFTYKDNAIESLSDAQKILLRIGEDNIIVIKSVLLDISGQLKKI